MRKILLWMLLLILCIAGCGKSESVEEAEKLIAEIGEVTLLSEKSILDAETAVANLTKWETGQVKQLEKLENARTVFDSLVVSEVENAIENIGVVGLESEEKIKIAREKYNKLSVELCQNVRNYNYLVDAEKALMTLKVTSIEEAIRAIGIVEVDDKDKEKIQYARSLYDNASVEIKQAVDNYNMLESAEERYVDFAVKEMQRAIKVIEREKIPSNASITNAREICAKYDIEIQNKVANIDVLLEAEKEYAELFEVRVKEVEDAIDRIGVVSLQSEDAIKEARNLYELYDCEIQQNVKNGNILEEAEIQLSNIQAEEVDKLISKLGKISLNSKEKISAARNAYDSLNDMAKNKVTKLYELESAESALEALELAEYEKQKKEAFSKLNSDYDKIQGVTWYHHKEEPEYANSRCYIFPYIGVYSDDDNALMRLTILYTSRNWVFWEDLTIYIDGEKYYKSYDYSRVHRDNGSGDVWEYVDIKASDKDMEMLRKIVSSKDTTIRFSGDQYYYDFTVRDKDKEAIKDVLDAFEFLK